MKYLISSRGHHPIIHIDCETGGLDPNRHALLSVALVSDFVPNLHFYVREPGIEFPENGLLTDEAMRVNNLDINQVLMLGKGRTEAAGLIAEYVDSVLQAARMDGVKLGTPIVAGYNTQFDIRFMSRVMADTPWPFERLFWYKHIDLFSLAFGLMHLKCEILGQYQMNSSLGALYSFVFGEELSGAHDAEADATAVQRLVNELMDAHPDPVFDA